MDQNNRILIIDDDEGVRETYAGIFIPEKKSYVLSRGQQLFDKETFEPPPLKRRTYDICLAENGLQGIEKATKARETGMPFAVAFIDMKMPGLNGAQTSRRLWEIDPDLKIVIVTAYSEYTPEDIISVTGRDDIFYLRKPFNYEEILQFARALTNEWNLERNRSTLEKNLITANEKLADMNDNLRAKVQQQATLIVQAEKMASVGILAAGVAHEINNPLAFINSNLATIKSYFERIITLYEKMDAVALFLDTLANPAAEELLKDLSEFKEKNKIKDIVEDLDYIADESIEGLNRIKMIVQDLKNFSRLDEMQFEKTDINNAIESALHMVWSELKHKATIEKKLGDIPLINGFPQKISQVFLNLLINASQAIEKSGTITVETKLVHLGRRKGDRFVEINISDTGCGIPEENIKKLYDPFFTTKPAGTGTGLGLSIVYEIIKAHNGDISVHSRLGEGSTFCVHLPLINNS
ncbi:ATP-binding protein [uncultured Desulfobacter sp.]|uniref:hybrid sensor histidine kinase/response regulator n=1 Tax=uncultured Desulfobacter sp. TaxID=240139 RepID=UPI002AAC2F3C|nr:ATP-binding protein [uncultured Desulfobacter sp.]